MLTRAIDIVGAEISIFTGTRDELARERKKVCNVCEFKEQHIDKCKRCGCPLKRKTRAIKYPCDLWPQALQKPSTP